MWPVSNDYEAYREPHVPETFIRYTNGHEDYDAYLRSGFEVASMLNLALRKHFGRLISDSAAALDFGCGSGRLARFVNPQSLCGCDVNRAVVTFCKQTLPDGRFYRNGHKPPLRYADGSFDLIYSFSVFSHLRLDVEQAWLAELARVAKPGCAILLSVHGDWMIDQTLGDEAEAARQEGFLYREVHGRTSRRSLFQRDSMDFPDYYEASYHTSTWIQEHWNRYFEVLEVIKGDDASRYLSGELAFVPEGDVPVLRPMGQDLVVAVKR